MDARIPVRRSHSPGCGHRTGTRRPAPAAVADGEWGMPSRPPSRFPAHPEDTGGHPCPLTGPSRHPGTRRDLSTPHVLHIVLRVRPAPVHRLAPWARSRRTIPGDGRRAVPRSLPGAAPGTVRPARAPRPPPAAPIRRSGRLDVTGPQGAPAADRDRLRAADLPGVPPGAGAAPQRPLGAARRHGRAASPAVAKCLLDHSPVWAERFRHEIAAYRAFVRHRPPVRVPRLVAADPDSCTLVMERMPGRVARTGRGTRRRRRPGPTSGPRSARSAGSTCGGRRPGSSTRPLRLRRADRALPRAGPAHRPGPAATCRSCCTGWRTRRAGRRQFCHGDALLSNVLLSPAGPVAGRLGARGLVPARLRPGGAVVGARRRPGGPPADQPAGAGGGPGGSGDAFLVNLMLVLTREIRTLRDGGAAHDARHRSGGDPGAAEAGRGAAAAAAPAARRLRAGPPGGAGGGRHPLTRPRPVRRGRTGLDHRCPAGRRARAGKVLRPGSDRRQGR